MKTIVIFLLVNYIKRSLQTTAYNLFVLPALKGREKSFNHL